MHLDVENFYRVLAPRPVVLVSTVDGEGRVNAAPFSFVMPVSMNPPLVAFASGHDKDTLSNIRETKEFVVNIPPKEILENLWVCGNGFPRGVNEIEESGLAEEKSETVKAPRIKECIGWFECKLESEVDVGDHIIVIGKIINAEVKDSLIDENGNLDIRAGNLMHIGGREFAICEKIWR
ncbi:MAG TPA: flavin reductase family protein [Candidatus Altiarchaeales archaeon]|nr:flavin reductase family protein [Candidatus Altiarchaeales archaeon]